jgi:DNA-binding XRE family transcriptional regulator
MEVSIMPFEKADVGKTIATTLSADPELERMWNGSRSEYRVLGELVKLRKEKGLSQVDLAKKTGNKQQAISRIENRENSPTLKTLCGILDVLDYDIQFVPRQRVE